MKLNSARQAWHDAYFMPWAQSIEMIELGCRVQKTQHDKSASSAMHQALAGCIQRAVDTLPNDVRNFGHWIYNPLADNDHRERAEDMVFSGAISRIARMTAKKAARAEYVAKVVLYRYRRMHQGGQSSALDPLPTPESFRVALLDVYGVNLSSEQWAREWVPFIQTCFDVCNDIDRAALSPVAAVVNKMMEVAA